MSRERLASIVDSMMEAVITVDRTQRIVLFNKAAETIFCCQREQALGKTLDAFIPERFRASHRQHIQEFGHTGVPRRSMSSPGVLVGLRADGEEFPMEATISDNGPGIPREVRHKLFEPFFTTKGEKGTGLGLWVSRSLVEKHGGRLRVRSRPGVGTAFSIFLPGRMATTSPAKVTPIRRVS